jgi:hypothetical protein
MLILLGLEVSTKKLTLMHVLNSENIILVSDREGYIHFIDSSGVTNLTPLFDSIY